MAAEIDPHEPRGAPSGRHGTRESLGTIAARGAVRIGDAFLDPRILLAWFLTFVGASGLVGLLVPVREGGALLARRLVAGTVRRPATWKALRITTSALAGLAAFGISAVGLLLWGTTAGWTILGLLAVVALTSGIAAAAPRPEPRHPHAAALAGITGMLALLALGLVLALELGPRGALVVWAVMVAGGLWLLAALLFAVVGAPGPAGTAPRRPAASPSRQLNLVRILLVPAALAPPYMVALVSENPGRGLAALGSLLAAAALAALLTPSLLHLAARPLRQRLAAAAGLAALALALAALADLLGWIAAPFLLPALVFGVAAAERARVAAGPAPDTGTALAFLAGALLVPLSMTIGTRAILLVLAALLLLAIPAALRLPTDAEGA